MTDSTVELIKKILIETDCQLLNEGMIHHIAVEGTRVTIALTPGFPCQRYQQHWINYFTPKLLQIAGLDEIDWQINSKIKAHAIKPGLKRMPEIKNVIAVASGKGGVGKSTVAVNLAFALKAEGAEVALLDADIYGPSIPLMLGVKQLATSEDGKNVQPMQFHGIQSMSLGYLLDNQDTPMIWRGPMVSGALQQLFNNTLWHNIDYMIIDLPPGTGDIQLTLTQKIPLTAAIVVTTPQEVALLDVNKAIKMFEKVDIPVMGIVENMAVHTCSACGHQEHIFSKEGGKQLAERYQLPLLASLPLDAAICRQAEIGVPIVSALPEGDIAKLYQQIAVKLTASLSLQKIDYSDRFPSVVVEKT